MLGLMALLPFAGNYALPSLFATTFILCIMGGTRLYLAHRCDDRRFANAGRLFATWPAISAHPPHLNDGTAAFVVGYMRRSENMTETKPDTTSTEPPSAQQNRGKRPNKGSGEVSGSGAGAGGSGAPEDYDSDPVGGGGAFPPAGPEDGGSGADAPSHGSR